MYRAYLAQYPRGAFAPLARLTIAQAGPQQAARAKPPRIERPASPARPAVGTIPEKGGAPKSFKDCPNCPEMVAVPPGSFRMGHSRDVGAVYTKPARPVHQVTIPRSFAISRYEVTFDEYDRFTEATGRSRLDDKGWGRGRHPALRVSRADAIAYAGWLSARTGHRYRLPSEAEWEYAARGGKETNFWWGDAVNHDLANFGSGAAGWLPAPAVQGKDTWQTPAPVGSFPPNPFGLYDMHGNLWEFVQDCYHDGYDGAPTDGSAWLKPPKSEFDDEDNPTRQCEMYVLRGGSSGYNPNFSMSASRIGINWAVANFLHYGIRLVRELD